MKIKTLVVEDFGPIRGKRRFSFNPGANIIIGYNGSGKTHLVHLLATLAGNDRATQLCAGKPIGTVKLYFEDGKSIKLTKSLDESQIRKFKQELGDSRLNFGLPEDNSDIYQHGCCENDTFKMLMTRYVNRDSGSSLMFRNPYYSCGGGDGYRRKVRLAMLKSIGNLPLLLESPEQHIHLVGQQLMCRMLSIEPGQVILTTHSPEMLNLTENIIDLSS